MKDKLFPLKLRPILSTQEMLAWEKLQLKGNLQQAAQWMDRAALGMGRWLMQQTLKEVSQDASEGSSWRYTLILAGPGGNGGDGWALARRLKQAGWDPLVAYLRPSNPLTAHHLAEAQKEGVRSIALESFLTSLTHEPFDLIVDALLGLGARGPVSAIMQETIEWANRQSNQRLLRVSLDCPSGWQAGSSTNALFSSGHTLCVQYVKKEELFPPVLKEAGQLHLIDLHLEELGVQDPPSSWKMLDPTCSITPPQASRVENKYTRGVIYLIAGSAAYPGSATLCEQGAWLAEPGMVYTTAPPKKAESVHLAEPLQELRQGSILAIGPGLAPSFEGLKTLKKWLTLSTPCSARVLDAGALFHLSQDSSLKNLLNSLPGLSLLTPHEGELDRLLLSEEPAYSRA